MSATAHLDGPPLGEIRHLTIPEALAFAARTSTAGIVLVDAREAETVVPFSQLHRSARRIASALISRGIAPGDRVALVLPTGRDFLDAFFGAQLAGAVPVPLYPPVRLGRMDEYVVATARMLTAAGARLVLSDTRVKLLLGRAIELARPPLGCPTVQELRSDTGESELAVPPDALGVIQFSSGSTVDPKPVALSHRQLVAQCASLRILLNREPVHHVGVSWLPLYHDMGLIGCLLSAVTYPGKLVLLPPEAFLAKPALWLRAIARHRGTVSPAPNFAYGLCAKRVRDEELAGADLSTWRFALNGAEPVSAETTSRFCSRFGRFGFRRESLMPVYGLSEASLAVSFTAPVGEKRIVALDATILAAERRIEPGPRAIVSVGTPVPGASVEVRGESGEVLPERRVGRIWARAPFVMTGYFGHPDATARALVDGWLDTGDLGFVDAGELFVCGRAKDVVIIRGANHAPQEFEECVDEVPGVRTGCVVAVGLVAEGEGGEGLVLLVETTPEASEGLDLRISAHVLARTGVKPDVVRLLEPGTLPRTSSGKLRRGEALRRFVAGTLAPPEDVNVISLGRSVARSMLGYAKARLP